MYFKKPLRNRDICSSTRSILMLILKMQTLNYGSKRISRMCRYHYEQYLHLHTNHSCMHLCVYHSLINLFFLDALKQGLLTLLWFNDWKVSWHSLHVKNNGVQYMQSFTNTYKHFCTISILGAITASHYLMLSVLTYCFIYTIHVFLHNLWHLHILRDQLNLSMCLFKSLIVTHTGITK